MSREAFEAWFSDQGRFPRACEKGRDGGYLLQHANTSWSAWQAARDAALDEAAEACESEAENWRGEQSVIDFRLCAARIRALKEQG